MMRVPVVLLAIGLSLPLSAQDIYKKPGHRGSMETPPAPVGPAGGVTFGPHAAVECARDVITTATHSKRVESCDRVQFKDLYDLDVADANAFGSTFRCPEGCAPAYVYQIARHSTCKDDVATFELTFAVVCPKTEKPQDLDPPRPQQLDRPFRYARDGERWHAKFPDATLEVSGPHTVGCDKSVYVRWRHIERGLAIAGDYTKAVTAAEREAQAFYSSLSCEIPCTKSKWESSVVYVSWDTNARHDEITVDIYMKLDCRR